ncbi:MAG: CopG family transcriptional regulator [Candidatus Micrarchaeota archaeon]|nr:CopG family transcriptional regulator [Candidatus Micrarchaeota archaeon]MDE1833782.1 CopG family transcriptional regulator [Candidatus Micrarchaeota archaeon]MDE1858930.1 CopG family transcriptional regulator [Candidatus Micrarchaeota archaeon]
MAGEKRKYTTITIPTALFDNIKREIAATGFSSVSDYATYILRETTAELALRKSSNKSKSAIAEKLKALGYIS